MEQKYEQRIFDMHCIQLWYCSRDRENVENRRTPEQNERTQRKTKKHCEQSWTMLMLISKAQGRLKQLTVFPSLMHWSAVILSLLRWSNGVFQPGALNSNGVFQPGACNSRLNVDCNNSNVEHRCFSTRCSSKLSHSTWFTLPFQHQLYLNTLSQQRIRKVEFPIPKSFPFLLLAGSRS